MSWFDTSSIANIARTALKEAQRTIDKALDINDSDEDTNTISPDSQISINKTIDDSDLKTIEKYICIQPQPESKSSEEKNVEQNEELEKNVCTKIETHIIQDAKQKLDSEFIESDVVQSVNTCKVSEDKIIESSPGNDVEKTSEKSIYQAEILDDKNIEKDDACISSKSNNMVLSVETVKYNAENNFEENCIESVSSYDMCKSLSNEDEINRKQNDVNADISCISGYKSNKVGSDLTSGHTSSDDLETTSSDIEIISSPNGDSSSNHSRHSPAKFASHKQKIIDPHVIPLLEKKSTKGYYSEFADDNQLEINKLLKRLNEMTEILEKREAKIIDLNRCYVEVQEENNSLKKRLDSFLDNEVQTVNLSQVTEEYTQRLSVLEDKLQKSIREKDTLQKQLDILKQESANKLGMNEVESLLAEKNEIIKELREEGEKLSKTQLQQSNIIKKLRAKEKTDETTIKNLKDTLEDYSSDIERLKKLLSAKEDVEKMQIEAVHQLTSKNKKLNADNAQLQSQIENLTEKYECLKKQSGIIKEELEQKNRSHVELQLREKSLKTLEQEKLIIESYNNEMKSQLDDFRTKLSESEKEFVKREEKLRQENFELMCRLEEIETRNEELSHAVLEASKPLLLQIESLQASYEKKLATLGKVEQSLMKNINDLQKNLQVTTDLERKAKEESVVLKNKLCNAEKLFEEMLIEKNELKIELENKLEEQININKDLSRKIKELEENLLSSETKIEELIENNKKLNFQLSNHFEAITEKPEAEHSRKNDSPMLSTERMSPSESNYSLIWVNDDTIESNTVSRCTNMLEMQVLQSTLKQKEGEIEHLTWELKNKEQECNLLNNEMAQLSLSMEEMKKKLGDLETKTTILEDLQQKYDTLCLLYGEKVEETEELKLDLQDVKEMYRIQISDILKQNS